MRGTGLGLVLEARDSCNSDALFFFGIVKLRASITFLSPVFRNADETFTLIIDSQPRKITPNMSNAPKVKGVDVVILLDVTDTMQDCIDAVKANISSFISDLCKTGVNGTALVKDWRMKVCGYRDQTADGDSWFIDNPFVRDVASVERQLDSPSMTARGGGEESGSLLDALFRLSQSETVELQDGEDSGQWRPLGDARRVIIFFTDATFKSPMTLPEGSGGTVIDVITLLQNKKIKVCGFVPEWQGYDDLFGMDGAECHRVATIAETPALAGLGQPGEAGLAAIKASVAALSAFSRNFDAFKSLMCKLARDLRLQSPLRGLRESESTICYPDLN